MYAVGDDALVRECNQTHPSLFLSTRPGDNGANIGACADGEENYQEQ